MFAKNSLPGPAPLPDKILIGYFRADMLLDHIRKGKLHQAVHFKSGLIAKIGRPLRIHPEDPMKNRYLRSLA